jgi:uracil-DNA glycosylase family 4
LTDGEGNGSGGAHGIPNRINFIEIEQFTCRGCGKGSHLSLPKRKEGNENSIPPTVQSIPFCLISPDLGPSVFSVTADNSPMTRMERLYAEMFTCEKCFGATGCQIGPDPERVRRTVLAKAVNSKVFVVGQALSRKAQRKSGLPYLLPNGRLTQTGRKLDAFLASFDYTINPKSERQYAYSSDLVQHYPGKVGRGDRRPSSTERNNCSTWLKRELELIRPRVVILLGKLPARDFLSRYELGRGDATVLPWGRMFECEISGWRFVAFAVPHFSYRFRANFVNAVCRETAQLIRHFLSSNGC